MVFQVNNVRWHPKSTRTYIFKLILDASIHLCVLCVFFFFFVDEVWFVGCGVVMVGGVLVVDVWGGGWGGGGWLEGGWGVGG